MELKEIEPAIIGFTGGMYEYGYELKRGDVTTTGYLATNENLYTETQVKELLESRGK
ncbi:hypothetical protein AM2_140 [Lactococcus phage AM2]|uniref:Uncharacterized protein n=7 Tax=Audreyjarvisvirus AM1 TaxID=2845188 RepID=A0A1W6JLS0_9CAUD|nr:hypothetical protein H1Z30_gp131 [Lactococcus phage AM1]ARM66445.1 hypothetical protein AM2_140 [Lactococcus phage AM2]ARM66622.1 hypothetical protein AM3_140 [Lactococcus phage AM3]ARM67176.1 hypothetical protein AM8_141 [Lactococcus phage AM8]ARM67354.1 hypothetical protein AM9_141 [Lactococcus phage AM9]ARM67533.1 hypothetical protein AM11_141 [Lactococcus phage AM11]ARQ95720.1 hypothetical protein AM12_141 [Lactococcus phage AM12]